MTMIEKVARAIYDTVWYEGAYDNDSVNGETVHIKEAREQARAAIAAMREPSEAMIAAAPYEVDAKGNGFLLGLLTVWPAMIDAALAEGDKNV